MMKNSQIIRALAIALTAGTCSLLFTSCETDEPALPDPEVTINTDNPYSIDYKGGEIRIPVQIENPAEDLPLTLEPKAEWLTAEYSADNIIIDVEPLNDRAERTGTVSVIYGEYYNETIIVAQSGEPAPFSVSITDVTATTVTVDITPLDNSCSYMIRPIRKDVFDSYTDENAFLEAEMEYIDHMETDENTTLAQMLYTGSQSSLELLYLDTDTEYYICIYAIDESGNVLSEVVQSEVFKTNEITFEITASTSGIDITVDVTASDDKAPFIFYTVSSDYLDEHDRTVKDAADYNLYYELWTAKTFFGNNTIQAIPTFSHFGTGSRTFSSYSIDNYTHEHEFASKYIIYVTTVNQYGEAGTFPIDTLSIYTEEISLSDNIITVNIDNITSSSWDLHVTTTNNDPYVAYWDYADKYEGWTEEQLIAEFSDGEKYDYLFYLRNGDYNGVYPNKDPDTEYVMFFFGWEGGVMTTDFQAIYFRTLPAE